MPPSVELRLAKHLICTQITSKCIFYLCTVVIISQGNLAILSKLTITHNLTIRCLKLAHSQMVKRVTYNG